MSGAQPFSAGKILDDNPALKKRVIQFMTLYDATQVLAELKPPHYELASAYVKEIADRLMRDAGLPGEFVEAMIKARPPLTEPQ